MRTVRLVIPIAMLALTVAGCGGGSSKVVVQEVPGGAVEISVTGGDALAPQPTATATVDASATATPAATTTGGTAPAQSQPQQSTAQQPAPTQSAPQTSANGGASAPAATPPPGADKQQFEAFCQQNPGAC